LILVSAEKFKGFYGLRFVNGDNKGQLVTNEHFDSMTSLTSWSQSQGFELIEIVSVYRQIQIAKGDRNAWYAFGLCGLQVFTGYKFNNEKHVKLIIEWHHDAC
jgi:hypothetical protein